MPASVEARLADLSSLVALVADFYWRCDTAGRFVHLEGAVLAGRDLDAVGDRGEHNAGPHGLAIHKNGASAAHAVFATEMRARQASVIADEIRQRQAGFHIGGDGFAVYRYRNLGHAKALCTARLSATACICNS